ncbi:MAG: Hint domain-containing protein [Paracoccus sp. (in: a-proteobacteria)]|uniref:Hint domain-containing protein n=1 Tax=Paracoccus sp. TaxID=267 RepID=UPI0039E4E140
MSTVPGGSGAEYYEGTSDADSIFGGGGDDTLLGLAGNDTIDGGEGSDSIDGGEGADYLIWEGSSDGGDSDVVIGGDGHVPVYDGQNVTEVTGSENYTFDPYNHNGGDTLALNLDSDSAVTLTYSSTEAGTATDANGNTVEFSGIERIILGDGDNTVDASGAEIIYQDGADHYVGIRLYSGAGDDTITGSDGTDYIDSGDGDDIVYGGDGNDVIETGGGDDYAYGEDGDDGFRWGDGSNDTDIGNDYYDGGSGSNTLNAWQYSTDGSGVHVVLDSDSSGDIDALGNAEGHLRFENFSNLRTGVGNDIIDGRDSNVDGYRVYADSGNDLIYGSGGDDTIEGGEGADTIIGGQGNDFISMNGDIFASTSLPDSSVDTLVLEDDFGSDTVRGFSFGEELDSSGNTTPADVLDVSGLTNSDGDPVQVGDVVVRADVDQYGNSFAVIVFPNGEELWMQGVDPDSLTPSRLHSMGIPCFCRGTLIHTEHGDIAVEELRVGDLVETRDHGLQAVRWIGSRALDRIDLAFMPRLRPIRISAGALGNALPRRDLLVSPQHRVLVRSAIAQRMFGADEVLVAARQLLDLDGIDELAVEAVEYFHILFEQHEIVFSEGAETESLYTGDEAIKALGEAARDEIFTLFPQLRQAPAQPARPFVPGAKARQMVQRHRRNHKSLVQG